MLAMIERMPSGWRFGATASGASWSGALQARLRSPEREFEPGPGPSASPGRESLGSTRVPGEGGAAPRSAPGAAGLPRYVPAGELDEKPLFRSRPEPDFPAGVTAASGRVVLRLYIGDTGDVDPIAVASVEPEPAFEEPAVRAFASARFTPGRKRGVAVKSVLTIEVLFGLALPITLGKPPEGQLFQPPRGRTAPATTRRNNP